MPISANTLFHFTRDYGTLVKILQSKLFPRLCLEEKIVSQLPMKLAIPMVCFCDIPLSQISNHASKYGHYAIGIRKDWAMQQGVTPVLYVHDNSLIPQTIFTEIRELSTKITTEKDKSLSKMMRYLDTICMMKPYSVINEQTGVEVRYYDEREWRYVPPRKSDDQFCYLIEEHYNKEDTRKSIDRENEEYGVTFHPDVINYLIVDKESEVLRFKQVIENIKGDFSHSSVELLTTRIISMERIRDDV